MGWRGINCIAQLAAKGVARGNSGLRAEGKLRASARAVSAGDFPMPDGDGLALIGTSMDGIIAVACDAADRW
jgi:hypothetical protein